MDEIEEVVAEIVNGCRAHKLEVSELLAAFVARTVLEGDSVAFALDKDLTDDDVNSVINLSVTRLLEKDSPKLETVKMQVAFDSSHVKNEEDLASKRADAERRNRDSMREILSTKRKCVADCLLVVTYW